MISNIIRSFLFLVLPLAVLGQGKRYSFPAPPGWQTEEFTFPIKFAPAIPLSGTEELHLSPGWGKAGDDQYWSYVFVWYLDGQVTVKPAVLDDYLQQYYTGLYLTNLGKKPKPPENFTHADVKAAATNGNDAYYEGTISTLDFLSETPILFYVHLDIRQMPDGHTAFLYEVSPKKPGQEVWKTLAAAIHSFK